MPKIKVFYTEKQVADQGNQGFDGRYVLKSPSALKPKQIADAIKGFEEDPFTRWTVDTEFVEPNPVKREHLYLAHDKEYVDGILDLKKNNGFGNTSKEIADSLLYTNGAMVDAALAATVDNPTCALVSGFHHAGWECWEKFGYFCTFNGLIVSAFYVLNMNVESNNIAIIDCDQHWGNGTDDILNVLPKAAQDFITHISFGRYFDGKSNIEFKAREYLNWLRPDGEVETQLKARPHSLIIYQAGADVHVNDPYGGCLTTEQIAERDYLMFSMAKRLQIPICWNLAGGYQIDKDGKIDEVLKIHLNTFLECQKVYGNEQNNI